MTGKDRRRTISAIAWTTSFARTGSSERWPNLQHFVFFVPLESSSTPDPTLQPPPHPPPRTLLIPLPPSQPSPPNSFSKSSDISQNVHGNKVKRWAIVRSGRCSVMRRIGERPRLMERRRAGGCCWRRSIVGGTKARRKNELTVVIWPPFYERALLRYASLSFLSSLSSLSWLWMINALFPVLVLVRRSPRRVGLSSSTKWRKG